MIVTQKGMVIPRLNKQLINWGISTCAGQQITFKIQVPPLASYVTSSKLVSLNLTFLWSANWREWIFRDAQTPGEWCKRMHFLRLWKNLNSVGSNTPLRFQIHLGMILTLHQVSNPLNKLTLSTLTSLHVNWNSR